MDKKYVELFKALAQATAVTAETVMDYDQEHEDQQGFDTAKIMRDDFQAIVDKIKEEGETYLPNRAEVARLLVGAMIIVNQLQGKVETLHKTIASYQTEVINKLQSIIDNTKPEDDDEIIHQMVNEKFIIEETK